MKVSEVGEKDVAICLNLATLLGKARFDLSVQDAMNLRFILEWLRGLGSQMVEVRKKECPPPGPLSGAGKVQGTVPAGGFSVKSYSPGKLPSKKKK